MLHLTCFLGGWHFACIVATCPLGVSCLNPQRETSPKLTASVPFADFSFVSFCYKRPQSCVGLNGEPPRKLCNLGVGLETSNIRCPADLILSRQSSLTSSYILMQSVHSSIHSFMPTARCEAGCWQHSFSEYPQDGLSSSLVSAPVERPSLTSSSSEGPCPHSLTWFLPGLDIRKYHRQGPSRRFQSPCLQAGIWASLFSKPPRKTAACRQGWGWGPQLFLFILFSFIVLNVTWYLLFKNFFLPVFPTRKHFS